MRFFRNPLFLFCFIPGFYILFGALYAMQYTEINWLSFSLLYVYIILNQIMENILKKIYKKDQLIKYLPVVILESLLLLTIAYFGISYSYLTIIVLLFYALIIQGQYLFHYYELSWLSVCIISLLKACLLNGISFYLHTGFISIRILLWVTPLFLPALIMEANRWGLNKKESYLKWELLLTYIIGIGLMSMTTGIYAAALFLSIPFAFHLWVRPNTVSTKLFTASFFLAHFLSSLLAFLFV